MLGFKISKSVQEGIYLKGMPKIYKPKLFKVLADETEFLIINAVVIKCKIYYSVFILWDGFKFVILFFRLKISELFMQRSLLINMKM